MRRVMFSLVLAPSAALLAQPPSGLLPVRADSLFFADQWAAAKASYDSFLVTHPGSTQARIRAGYSAIRLGRPGDAVPYFERVLADSSASRAAPNARAGLAIARAMQGDRDRALAELGRAVEAGYGNLSILDQEPGLASLRQDPEFRALRDRAERQQFPCLHDPRSRAFDFWLGEWDAYFNGTVQLAGRSRIERVSGGCVILENWTTNVTPFNAPYEGKSLNFFESETGKWRQVWVGSAHDVNYFDAGEYRDGAMRFTYQRTTPQGDRLEGRFIFYNLGPNKVRQFHDQSTDGGKTYQVTYDFIYVRRGSGESPLPRVEP